MAEQNGSVELLDLPDENLPCEEDENKNYRNGCSSEQHKTTDRQNSQELKDKISKLAKRNKSVKILVTGLTGTGKSTLINAMLGSEFGQTHAGPNPCQKDVELHKHEYEGIRIKIYDTRGFGDSVTSEKRILKNISKKTPLRGFDLILLVLRMDNKLGHDAQNMLQAMSRWVDNEMWHRTVVVLTFANAFVTQIQLKYHKPTIEGQDELMKRGIEEFKKSFQKFVHNRRNLQIIINIPFVLAGTIFHRELPIDEDWLMTLWNTCILQCREEVRPFLKCFRYHRLVIQLKVTVKKILHMSQEEEEQEKESTCCSSIDDIKETTFTQQKKLPPLHTGQEEEKKLKEHETSLQSFTHVDENTMHTNNDCYENKMDDTVKPKDNNSETMHKVKDLTIKENDKIEESTNKVESNAIAIEMRREEGGNREISSSVIDGLQDEIMSLWKSNF